MRFFFILSVLTMASTLSFAGTRDSRDSKALYDGLHKVGLANVASSVSCRMELGGAGGSKYTCQLQALTGKKYYEVRDGLAEGMLSALQGMDVSKGEGGAYAEFVRCARNDRNADREYECFVATLIDCKEGILFCRDKR